MGRCFYGKKDIFFSALSVLCVFLLSSFSVYGFNIDAFNYAVYGTREESMFGFTVAIHKQGHNRGWVLVGAPEAQSQYQGDQVLRGGVVYKCRPDGDDPCQEIPFDRKGNQFFGNREMDQKSKQWFGASLSTSGNPEGGPIVACAPRYVWYSREMNRRDPVGTCFVSDSYFENFEEYSPCRTSNWGYHRQGSCEAGFSAAINSIGDRLFVGAPGSYFWQGQMYSIDAHASFNYTPGLLGTTYGAKGSVHQQSLETRPAVFQTREGREQDDDSYMGYSTIVGDFLDNGEQGIAVGMPRGSELRGRVLLFTWNLTNYKNISGSQLGSYFGYSLAAADVDGDKKLDLIVGAPMHTEPNTQDKYDVGRVYVFYQGGRFGSFNTSSFIDGTNSKGRFGHSVAYLGDLNQDGYEDFAVGAPYDGENNRGAVYIYYGSAKGVLEKYGQVIYAKDVNSVNGIPVSTFGFSITGGLDMDGNDYPDMAVGAYLANSAFFFRSRPVVRVESFVRFRTENKQIDIKKKNCNLPNGQRGTCTSIDFCVKYGGKGIPQQIRLNVQYILDTKKPNIPRMAFLRKNSHTLNDTIILYKDSQDACKTEEIFIKNDIRDKLTQLEAEVKYFMIHEDRDSAYFGRVRNPRSDLSPVLDLNLPPSRRDSIIIQKNCGNDNICVPNLHISVTKNVEKYLLDSNTNLEFDIIVSNFGEDAFETTFDVKYPEGIYYKKTEVKDDMDGILCSPAENMTISCDIGNPLPAGKIAKFQMVFVPYHKQGMSATYVFDMHVNSTNPENETTSADNYKKVTIDIWVDSALDVSGRSIPHEVYLANTSQYTSQEILKESDIGPQVVHLYTLRNKGPATIYEAEMYFLWPWQTLAGEDLLYLVEPPHVPAGVKCEPVSANFRGYELDYYTKPIWERLQIDSASTMSQSIETVHVESGQNITGVAGGTQVDIKTTKIDEEIGSSSGDSSVFYEKRHNASITPIEQGTWEKHTGGSIIKPGNSVTTKTEWRTEIINGKPVTKLTNVTTVMDSTGKIINTFYSTSEQKVGQVDSFGKSMGGYQQRPKPKIIYSSTGNDGDVSGQEDLSISSKHVSQVQESSVGGKSEQQIGSNFGGVTGGYVKEPKSQEEHAYTVGGGEREGGAKQQTVYQEEHIVRGETAADNQQGSSNSLGVEQSYEARQRYEERRQYEERLRQQQERERKMNQQKQGGADQNAINVDEERRRYEASLHQEEEERRRHQEQLKQREEARLAEERERQRVYEEEVRRRQQSEDERRREEEQRRRQQVTVNERRRQQQIEEETRRRQEEERSRQEEERRRQYELEENRRAEDERRRQWSGDASTGSSRQQSGRTGSSHGGRVRTGYFDAQGVYHDETGSQRGQGSGTVVNRTWTVEGSASHEDPGRAQQEIYGGQLDFGQAAATGNQFRTQTIDLGMVGGGSGGQEVSGGRQWVSSGQRTVGGGGVSDQDYYQSEWQRGRWDDSPSHNHVERDNVPTDRPDFNRRRGKRQVEVESDIADYLKCTATRCLYLKCVVGTLKKDEFISIALRSRLNLRAVRQLSTTQPVKLSSMMVARISELPYIGKPKEQALYSHEIFTDIPADKAELAPHFVPLWIILLSAIAGTLILLLVILLLYKCGFFKRKRPSTTPERQPLRSNGYHPGDEAL